MMQKNQLILLLAVMALGACQAQLGDTALGLQSTPESSNGPASPSSATSEVDRSYNIFYSPADHIEDLLDENRVEVASLVFERQRDYFSGDRKKKLDRLTATLSLSLTPEIAVASRNLAATSFTVAPEPWSDVKSTLSTADDLLKKVGEHDILSEPGRELSGAAALRTALEDKKKEFANNASTAFLSYPIQAEHNFFAEYPIDIDTGKFFENNQAVAHHVLAGDRAAELAAVYKTYENHLTLDIKKDFAQKYFDTVLQEERAAGKPPPQATLVAVDKVNNSGMPSPRFSKSEIALVAMLPADVTKTFDVKVENDHRILDQNLTYQDRTLGLFRAADIPGANTVVLLVPAVADLDREIIGYEDTKSEFRAGYKTTSNPRYAAARAEVDRARINLQSAAFDRASINSRFCYGSGCIGKAVAQIAAGVVHGKRQNEYQAAIAAMGSTPSTIDTPVYKSYSFNKTTLRVKKSAALNFYLVDTKNKKIYAGVSKNDEIETFNIPYGLHDDDRYRSRHLSGASSEETANEFASEAALVKTSKLLSEIANATLRPVSFENISQVAKRIHADERRLARARAEQSPDFGTTVKEFDKRVDSVVAVIREGNTVGSGFFVRPDLVVTNFHVIDGTQFVEVKTADGTKTFGRVLATDPRLDLALVETKAFGVPVKLYSKNDLPLGESVVAIGHPSGLEFSFTRGVISGVRDRESRRARGAGPVRFVQTDTPINPGNSGGPLFLGQQVIGVNTNKLAATSIEGIGFAVHYSEVREFLSRQGVGISPSG